MRSALLCTYATSEFTRMKNAFCSVMYIRDIGFLHSRSEFRSRMQIRDIGIQSPKINIFQISRYYVCFCPHNDEDLNKRMCHICEYKIETYLTMCCALWRPRIPGLE